MFTPPRFVVVDDKLEHLTGISRAIQELGSSCAQVRYDSEVDLPAALFSGVRALFLDLQLIHQAQTSDFKVHFAEVQRILSKVISPTGGPFLLILWTDAPERASELSEYLAANLYLKQPHTRPLILLPLSKSEFIDIATGDLIAGTSLKDAISERIASPPALAALLQWENEVILAAGRAMGDISQLASAGDLEVSLPTALKQLSTAAIGKSHVEDDKRFSVHAALEPLLHDHLQYALESPAVDPAWDDPFLGAPEPLPPLSVQAAAGLNSQVHITQPPQLPQPTHWGAISTLEAELPWDTFGVASEAQFVESVVLKNVRADKAPTVTVLQIRVGAACDYAQKTDGPIPYVLASFLPIRTDGKAITLQDSSRAWLSPVLSIDGLGTGSLFVEPRFTRPVAAAQADAFTVIARVREQLLIELITAMGLHTLRPGIVEFFGKN